jgi:hypothetical protein
VAIALASATLPAGAFLERVIAARPVLELSF